MAVINRRPTQIDLNLYSGDVFPLQFNFQNQDGTPQPVTGTWEAQIRSRSGVLLAEFAVNMADAAEGILYLSLTGEQTAMITEGEWDLQQTEATNTKTFFRGKVTVDQDVTRPAIAALGYGQGRYGSGPYGR